MKKSKILILLSLAAIAAGCALVFAGCKPDSDHGLSHTPSRWITDTEATCTEAGSKHRECTVCGELLEQKVISPKGHNFVGNVCSVCGVTASEGLAYKLSSDGCGYSVVGIGSCTDKDVVIPSSHQNLPVTEIGKDAFSHCGIISVALPAGVTSIGFCAFSACFSLTSISIPEGLISIDGAAFAGCSSLTSISIPDSITSIDSFAFSDCTSLTSITLSDNVTFIGHHSFSSCTSLTSIILPDKVVAIIFEAFRGCSGLTSVILPESLVSIGDRAFEDCSALTSVYYKGTKAEWDEISIGSTNEALQSATIYYYSETKPPLNGDGTAYDGNYWRYAADGVTPVIWKKQTAA